MQPGDETYILYGALFLVLFARLSHCYLTPRPHRQNIIPAQGADIAK